MKVEITRKGMDYLDSLPERIPPMQRGQERTSAARDKVILSSIQGYGPIEVEEIAEDFPVVRSSIRRLFEAGYIEEAR